MAWQDEMAELLRVMVQDMSTPPTYPDDTLQRVIVGAAHLVEGELDFSQSFFVDIPNRNIVPDPTDQAGGTRDDNFINLVCMKAAAIIDQGQVRSQSGIVIRDNGSMVDLHYKLDAAVALINAKGGWGNQYDEAKLIYQMDMNDSVVGACVMGPFRDVACQYYGWDVNPRSGLMWG